MNTNSPYYGLPQDQWKNKTQQLIDAHPFTEQEIVGFCLSAWNGIFTSSIGNNGLKIGEHLFPAPQIIGALLHELIPAEIAAKYPDTWRKEKDKSDKDIVYIPDNQFSIELKTSSNKSQIFGNRSYAQQQSPGGKSKDGYYLTVNFEKIDGANNAPSIQIIRFGWIDHTDWIGQEAATGQQSRLSPDTYSLKLKTLYLK